MILPRPAAVGSFSHSDFCFLPFRSIAFSSNKLRTLPPATDRGAYLRWHHPPVHPSRLPLFSTTYALPNLQPLCFDNVTTVGWGGTPHHLSSGWGRVRTLPAGCPVR